MQKTALITGGSRGIGRAIVERFVTGGYRVAACATTKKGAAAGDPELAIACDVADPSAVTSLFEQVKETFGTLDVVVNNAGIAGQNPMEPGSDDALWFRIIDINLHGTYLVTKAATALLNDGARIINVSSVLGLQGIPDQSAYCASKHAVIGLTRSLARHLAPRQITVNAICPGWVDTDMAKQRVRELGVSMAALEQSVPLGRAIAPSEVADMAAYLASNAASGVTGQTLVIDGGATA